MNNLLSIFCTVDDFCKNILSKLEAKSLLIPSKKRKRKHRLSYSEIMTLLVYFHCSRYRDFKTYYTQYVCVHLVQDFPKLVSYTRFVELIPSVMGLLTLFLHLQKTQESGIYFIDSTTLSVCHIKRAASNKVFRNLAKTSKSTMGWYHGFKLHILINELGEICAFKLTDSKRDDREVVPKLAQNKKGKLIGDKGYISSKLFQNLYQKGLKLITKIKKNMKNKCMDLGEKTLLRKRAIVESVIDQLKNISQVEHSRHRSPTNFLVNVLSGLVAYSFKEKKPSLRFNRVLLENI